MSEEEKKAIEILKKLQKKTPYIIWVDGTPYNKSNQLQTLLDLIEKQQKEIEEMREELQMYVDVQNNDIHNYISKDKIKDILNYLNDTELNNYEIVMAFTKMMKELLEENDGDHIPRID